MERGLRAKAKIIEDAPITDVKKFFDKIGIEITDETAQVLIQLSKEWDNLSQEDKDKNIDIFYNLPN